MTPEDMMSIIDTIILFSLAYIKLGLKADSCDRRANNDHGKIWHVMEESQRIQLRERARRLTDLQMLSPPFWISHYKSTLRGFLNVSLHA